VPEGGFPSLRAAGSDIALFSADQQLTAEQARHMILEPLFFPPAPPLEKNGS
jgi:hypothetical protein